MSCRSSGDSLRREGGHSRGSRLSLLTFVPAGLRAGQMSIRRRRDAPHCTRLKTHHRGCSRTRRGSGGTVLRANAEARRGRLHHSVA